MDKNSTKYFKIISYTIAGIFIIFSLSCTKAITFKPAVPIDKSYKKIILQKFEATHDLENEFHEVIVTCESTTMSELLKKNVAPIIKKARLSTSKDPDALIVKIRIIAIKMASSSARGLSGEFVGESEMSAEVKLIDAQTRNILRKDNLSTADIAPSSSSVKLSEGAIPGELGKMIAEYISMSIVGN